MSTTEVNTAPLALEEAQSIILGGQPVETETFVAKDLTAIAQLVLMSTIIATGDADFGKVIPIGAAFNPATHYIAGISYTEALVTESAKSVGAWTTGKFDVEMLVNSADVNTAVEMACKDAGIIFNKRVK